MPLQIWGTGRLKTLMLTISHTFLLLVQPESTFHNSEHLHRGKCFCSRGAKLLQRDVNPDNEKAPPAQSVEFRNPSGPLVRWVKQQHSAAVRQPAMFQPAVWGIEICKQEGGSKLLYVKMYHLKGYVWSTTSQGERQRQVRSRKSKPERILRVSLPTFDHFPEAPCSVCAVCMWRQWRAHRKHSVAVKYIWNWLHFIPHFSHIDYHVTAPRSRPGTPRTMERERDLKNKWEWKGK